MLSGASFRLILTSEQSAISLPDQVLVGIRPEDLDGSANKTENSIEMKVSVLEQLGHTLLVYGYLEDAQIVASVDPHTHVKLDSTIRLSLNAETLHVFDPANEKTLL